MKKRFLILILTIVSILMCIFGLSACNKVEFKVNFVVDGAIYSTLNTNGEEIIKMPENPTKEDYTFDGWFWDKDTWQTPFTANSLLDAPLSSDMSVYCKWKANTINVESVTLNKTEITLHENDVEYLTATVMPMNATDTNIIWETSNPTIATVVGGKVTAIRVGNATITATTVDGGKIATCNVYVSPVLVESVSLNHTTLTLLNGETKTLTATIYPNNATEKGVIWQSSNSSIVAVENGVIKAVGYGTATITAISVDGEKTATCTISIVQDKIEFKTLKVDGETVYGKVSNDTETFSFIKEIVEYGNATYKVFKEITCETEIYSKSISLSAGNNTVYVLQFVGKDIKLYTVTVRRRPLYEVTFNSNGGSAVENQVVEEDSLATEPTTIKTGYTFNGWDYDFTTPITETTTVNANWTANTDTKYTVNYYLQNLEDDNYNLAYSDELKGTTDTTANALIKDYEHFTYNEGYSKNVLSGNINGNGSLVLSVYYTRDSYTVTNANSSYGSITNAGTYKYGKNLTLQATENIGCDFLGWYCSNELLSSNATYSLTLSKNVTAKFAVKEEMKNFNFTSTPTTCEVTGIKNNNITNITIPNSVTSIAGGSFSGCNKLESITLPFVGASTTANNGYDQVFGYIFGYTIRSDSSTVSGATYQYESDSYYYHYYIPNTLKSVAINGGSSIGSEAFQYCDSLTSVTIGNGVTSIGSDAFFDCYSLTNVTIGNGVTSIGSKAFRYCSKLTSIVIPDSVTSIGGGAFYYCESLTSVTIGNGVTSIGSCAFSRCDSLKSINVDSNNSAYKSIDGNLYSKDGKTLIQYAIGKTENSFTIPYSVTSIGDSAFDSCDSLTSVTIGNGVTSIGSDAFYSCDSLTSIVIPDSVTSIGNYAFSRCDSLKSVTIGNGVTSIGKYAFYCSKLTSLIFRDSSTWYRTTSSSDWNNKTNGTRTSVTSSSSNATYFKSTYDDYYWYKL